MATNKTETQVLSSKMVVEEWFCEVIDHKVYNPLTQRIEVFYETPKLRITRPKVKVSEDQVSLLNSSYFAACDKNKFMNLYFIPGQDVPFFINGLPDNHKKSEYCKSIPVDKRK